MESNSQPFATAQVGVVTVVRFTQSSINSANLEPISHDLNGLVEGGARRILLNLTSVQYLFSDVLEAILRLHKKIQSVHGKLGLCNLQPTVQEIVLTTRLEKLLNIFADEEGALKGLSQD